jgi:hypothetical protein
MGSIRGWFWAKGGWLPVAAFAAALLPVALCAALYLGRLEKWQQAAPIGGRHHDRQDA